MYLYDLVLHNLNYLVSMELSEDVIGHIADLLSEESFAYYRVNELSTSPLFKLFTNKSASNALFNMSLVCKSWKQITYTSRIKLRLYNRGMQECMESYYPIEERLICCSENARIHNSFLPHYALYIVDYVERVFQADMGNALYFDAIDIYKPINPDYNYDVYDNIGILG